MNKSIYLVLLFVFQCRALLIADDANSVITTLGNQYSCHFTIEGCHDLFIQTSLSLPDNWKSQGLEKNLDALVTQLHSKWIIFKDPVLPNVFRIEEMGIQDITNNPLDKSLESFTFKGTVDTLRAAIVQLEPSIEAVDIMDTSNIQIQNGEIHIGKEGIHFNYNSIPVSISVGKSSIRDILTSHLPLDQFGPILWSAQLHQNDGGCNCMLSYGTFPLKQK